jgi:hypothetical protein
MAVCMVSCFSPFAGERNKGLRVGEQPCVATWQIVGTLRSDIIKAQ